MMFDDEGLKRIYQSYVQKRSRSESAPCPGIAQIDKIFDPRCRARAKFELIDHITRCPSCSRDFEFLLGLHRGEDELIRAAPQADAASRKRAPFRGSALLWKYSSLLCGLALVLSSLGIVLMHWNRVDTLRAGAMVIKIPAPSREFSPGVPVMLTWSPVRGAEFYIVEVFDGQLLPVWRTDRIRALRVILPKELVKSLGQDKPYFWIVAAYNETGLIAESELARYVLLSK